MFSDTIRSKTQMFYVTPEESETPVPTYEESPKKRKIIIKASPSFRGRANREPQVTEDSREPPARSPTLTPTATCLPHELNVYIPDASLLEPKPGTTPTELASILLHEDKGYFADVDSPKVATPITSSALVNHEKSPYTMSPSVLAGSGRSQVSGSLFVKGNRECIPLTGALSPYRQAILSQKTQALPIDSSMRTEDHKYGHLEPSCRPLINRPNGVPSALKDLFVNPTDNQATYARFKVQSLSSEDYEAGSESTCKATRLPSMGSRLTWDERRADRQQRYMATQAVSAETEPDTEDDMALKLQPCRTMDSPEVLRTEERSRAKSDPTKLPSYKKVRFETLNPNSALKYAIEAIERSSGEALDAELDESSQLTSALQYTVEAIERSSGTSIDDTIHDPPSPTGAFTYAVESIQQPSGPVLSAVMNPGGLRLDAVIRILRKDSKSQEPRMRVVFEDDDSQHPSKNEQDSGSINLRLPIAQTDDSLLKTPSKTGYFIGDSSTHNRSVSAQSAATTDSCAVTTHMKLCYDPPAFPSLHVRTTPVRRTSSINAEIPSALELHEDQELLPKTCQSSRSVSGCSVEVQPPSPTKEKILMEDDFPVNHVSTKQQAATPQLPLSGTTLETGATWQSYLDHKHVINGLSRSSSMCAPDGDFSLGDTEREICASPDPLPPSLQDSRLESFVLQGLIPREAIRQVSSLIDRMPPTSINARACAPDKSAVRSNNTPEVGSLCIASPETPTLWGEAFIDEEAGGGQKTVVDSTSPRFPMDIRAQTPFDDSDVVPLPTPWFESFEYSDDDVAGSVSPTFPMDILPQMPFDEADTLPFPTSWFEENAPDVKATRAGLKAVAGSVSPNPQMDLLPQMSFDEADIVPLPTSWYETKESYVKDTGVRLNGVARSTSPNLPMDILPQTSFDEADVVSLPTSWFDSPKPNNNDESGYMPVAPPLKRKERLIKQISLPSSNTQVLGASTPVLEFVAARLPVFGPSTTAHQIAQVTDKMQCGHKNIAKQVQSFRKKAYTTMSRTKTRIEPRRLGPQTSPLAILASQHSRKRSWKMRETSIDGGEFTYEAVGTLKPVLVTSSVKKGVWWIRHQPSPDGLDSPLAKKAKEHEGSDLMSIGTKLAKKDIDNEHEALELLLMGTTALIDVENRVTHAEETTDNRIPVLLTTLPTAGKHGVEEPIKSEHQKGNVQIHNRCTDDSKLEREQRSTTLTDDKTLPKESQVRERGCVSSYKKVLTVLEQDYEIDRIIDSLSAKLAWKEPSEIQVQVKEGQTPMESPAGEKMVRKDDGTFAVVSAFPCAVKRFCRDFSGMSGFSTEVDFD